MILNVAHIALEQPPSNPLLEVRHLTLCADNDKPRLRDMSLTLNHGERLVIIGPNGSGKSTLLRLLSSELKADQGGIFLEGRALSSYTRRQKARRISLMAQNDAADMRLRVDEYVMLGRLPHQTRGSADEDRTIVDQMLKDTGLYPLRAAYLGTLSGGEQQRAGLARALAQQPTLLLLDEPTNHLDPLARIQLLSLIRNKRIATVAVLHDLSLVSAFADRVLMINHGAKCCEGSPDDVFDSPLMQHVFGLHSFRVTHPRNGELLRCFEPA
ncbi:ABC transporter ATP-binding protein [Martelella alba]|uniref:ABC transporter ATP-binding protein n=2 Tax=Martelella alba TaxID=2590451 RepID=A0ABY2SFS6_9HYPH|nr:ABC transporter ATP-binding protein [Martelella alba]